MNTQIITLPARECDQRAVEWLAEKTGDAWSEDNFQVVLRECRDMHAAHPRANMRVDRFWSLSNKSHDLWVTIQRLLICHDWSLCDCINPKRSEADNDWENIMAYAKQLMPDRHWQYDDWRDAKVMRAQFKKINDWKETDQFAADYINGCGDKLCKRQDGTYSVEIDRDGIKHEFKLTALCDTAAQIKAQRAIYDIIKENHERLFRYRG